MATKQDLINEVIGKSWKGFYVLTAGALVTSDDGKTIQEFNVNYAENVGGNLVKTNLGFYVYQEGEIDEDAGWRNQPKTKDTARDAALAYLDGLAYIRTRLTELDEDALYGFATAWKDNGGSVSEVKIMLWKDGANPITHLEFA